MEENPFGKSVSTVPSQGSNAVVDIAMQREISEVQAMVILAKKFPRDAIQAMDNILVACQRPTLAGQALYTYARGGTDITGPSIRLAEAIAQAWGNIQFGVRELDQRNGESTVESYAWDMQSNVRQSKVFQVKHVRDTKRGSYAVSGTRDVYEVTANQASRRMRSCILSLVPGDVIDAAVKRCELTLAKNVDASPEAIQKMLETFANYGITKEQIENRIQRRVESITAPQIISLRKIYNSLKDSMSSPADWFDTEEPVAPKQGTEALKAAMKGKKKPEATAKQQVQEPAPEMAPGPCPEGGPMQGDTPTVEYCGQCPQRDDCPTWPAKE